MQKYFYKEGDKVGEFIYICKVESDPKKREQWAKFKCRCGKEHITQERHVRTGRSVSCGCMQYKITGAKNRKHAPAQYLPSGVKKMPLLRNEDVERFWTKVAITANPEKCWNWTWKATTKGYGNLTIGKGVTYLANRIAYYLHYKQDPEDNFVLHSCNNPACCNPLHLSLGTNYDNMQDMVRAGRQRNQWTGKLVNTLK